MRGALGALVVLAMLVPALAAAAQTENVRDDFGEVSYSGNDGSLEWAGSWTEGGESDGPAAGQIRVDDVNCSNNNCLQIRGGALQTVAASRKADLSGFLDANLTFDVHIDAALLSTAKFYVEARGDGWDWQVVESYGLLLADDDFSFTRDVTKYTGSDFELRFRLGGGLLGGDRVYIDKVMIAGAFQTTTTTTTTTTSSTTSSTSTTTTTLIKLPPPTLPELDPTTTTTIRLPELDPTTTTTTTTAATGTTTRPTTTTIESSERTTPESSDTTTPLAADGDSGDGGPGDSGGSSDGGASPSGSDRPSSGLRQTAIGLVSDFETGLFGSTPEVLAFDITPGFASAVELIEASWYWVLGLALLIAAALIKGIGRLGVIDRSR